MFLENQDHFLGKNGLFFEKKWIKILKKRGLKLGKNGLRVWKKWIGILEILD
jgi:hypothetical protein